MNNRYNLRRLLIAVALLAVFFLQSCDNNDPEPLRPGEDGFFIVNEGAFGNGNASLSFYDRDTDAVTNYVFKTKNGRDLGDQAQSMTVFENKGYVVVQNDSKIEVINVDDFSSIATIDEDLPNPRYFLGISVTKAYVSDWGVDGLTGTVKVVDLSTHSVTKTIPTGQGANKMILVGNLVYVVNAGGYGSDNTIKIIDTNIDAVTGSITVGDNPNSIVRDSDGNIWTSSSGATVYNDDFSIDEDNSTKGSLSKITSDEEVLRLEVDVFTYSNIGNLSISPDGKTLYYMFNGNVYSMATSATVLPTTPFKAKDYYGIAVDPFNGNIIGCEAPTFSSAGNIEIMDASGNILNTFEVGIAPNGCAFK